MTFLRYTILIGMYQRHCPGCGASARPTCYYPSSVVRIWFLTRLLIAAFCACADNKAGAMNDNERGPSSPRGTGTLSPCVLLSSYPQGTGWRWGVMRFEWRGVGWCSKTALGCNYWYCIWRNLAPFRSVIQIISARTKQWHESVAFITSISYWPDLICIMHAELHNVCMRQYLLNVTFKLILDYNYQRIMKCLYSSPFVRYLGIGWFKRLGRIQA